MVDAVTKTILRNDRTLVVHLTNISDGTGESAVVKVDLSADPNYPTDPGQPADYFTVDKIEYNINCADAGTSAGTVALFFDATVDDLLAVLPPESGCIDWTCLGGKSDPKSSGYTGDIVLTTNSFLSGDSYDITIYCRAKPA